MLRQVEGKISLGNKVTDIAICGHVVTTAEFHASALRRNGVIGITDRLKLFSNMFKDTWTNESIVKQAEELRTNFKLDTERFVRAEHLYKNIEYNFQTLFQVIFSTFSHLSILQILHN